MGTCVYTLHTRVYAAVVPMQVIIYVYLYYIGVDLYVYIFFTHKQYFKTSTTPC